MAGGSKTKTVGVVQVKGGAGRSTVATTIAGELAKLGTVALIDCDQPQGTATSWAVLRQALEGKSAVAAYTAATHRNLVDVVQRHTGTVDWIVLDGPPRLAEMTRAILALSDLALVPVGTSPAEVWATADVLPLIEEAKKVRAVDARLVWTRFRPHTRLAQDLETQAARELALKPLKAHMGFRVAYAEALGEGLTGAETGDAMAREEVGQLIAEIQRILR
jgi:chromosome partitioning protein